MYRILIVEDTPEEEATLRAHLDRYAAEHGLDLRITWQKSSFDLAGGDTRGFDLIFLDIDLPGIDGMEAARSFRAFDETTPIIFVTNLAQYAIHGYEVDALDFVVKPVSYYDFALRMDKALRVIGRASGRSITLSVDGALRVIPVNDIVYVEVSNHNLAYRFSGGEEVVARGTLSKLEQDLEGSSFVRVSNSCLANMAYIRQIRGSDIHMTDGSTVYFSRSRKKPALETIARYLGGSL